MNELSSIACSNILCRLCSYSFLLFVFIINLVSERSCVSASFGGGCPGRQSMHTAQAIEPLCCSCMNGKLDLEASSIPISVPVLNALLFPVHFPTSRDLSLDLDFPRVIP